MRTMVRLFLPLTLVVLSLSFSSCRQESTKKIVSNVLVETFDNDLSEKIASLSFQMDLDSAQLPAAYYDLPNDLGSVDLKYTESGNFIDIQINLTQAFKLPAGEATLPNGQGLPIYSSNGVVTIEIPQIKGKIYLATNGSSTVAGFAITISALDGIGNQLGRIGLFPSWMVNNVKIIAGLFSDPTPNNTGIAAFVNINRLSVAELASTNPGQLFFYIYTYNTNFLKYAERVYNEHSHERVILYPVER